MKTRDTVTFFRTIPIFYELSDDELRILADAAQEQCYTPGATVMELDTEEVGLCVLLEGECQAFVEHVGSGCEVELRRFYPGEHFGAEAILAGSRAVQRVRALSASRVLIVPSLTVLQLLATSGQFARALCRVFAGELQRTVREHRGIQFVHLEDFPNASSTCRLLPRRPENGAIPNLPPAGRIFKNDWRLRRLLRQRRFKQGRWISAGGRRE